MVHDGKAGFGVGVICFWWFGRWVCYWLVVGFIWFLVKYLGVVMSWGFGFGWNICGLGYGWG